VAGATTGQAVAGGLLPDHLHPAVLMACASLLEPTRGLRSADQAAWQTLAQFGLNDKTLQGKLGGTAVLHTHTRALDFHPHVHILVPAGAIDTVLNRWRSKQGKFLFPEKALARVFRGKWFQAMKERGWSVQANLPRKWIVDCEWIGNGEKALIYLRRYLYRGGYWLRRTSCPAKTAKSSSATPTTAASPASSRLPAQAEGKAPSVLQEVWLRGHPDRDPVPEESQTAGWSAGDGPGDAHVTSRSHRAHPSG
jgi:hypothetical protein